jgi:hypothetical protein
MDTQKTLFSSALKSGFIIAAIGIVVFILMYVLDIKPIGIAKPFVLMAIGLAINIVVLVVLFKKYRESVGGYISFKDAFLYCFIALLAGSIVSSLFSLVFMMFFDPDYLKNIMDAQKDFMESYLQGKMPEEQITETLDKMDAQMSKMTPVSSTFRNLIGAVIVDGIIALITGAIMKKNPSVFDDKGGVA